MPSLMPLSTLSGRSEPQRRRRVADQRRREHGIGRAQHRADEEGVDPVEAGSQWAAAPATTMVSGMPTTSAGAGRCHSSGGTLIVPHPEAEARAVGDQDREEGELSATIATPSGRVPTSTSPNPPVPNTKPPRRKSTALESTILRNRSDSSTAATRSRPRRQQRGHPRPSSVAVIPAPRPLRARTRRRRVRTGRGSDGSSASSLPAVASVSSVSSASPREARSGRETGVVANSRPRHPSGRRLDWGRRTSSALLDPSPPTRSRPARTAGEAPAGPLRANEPDGTRFPRVRARRGRVPARRGGSDGTTAGGSATGRSAPETRSITMTTKHIERQADRVRSSARRSWTGPGVSRAAASAARGTGMALAGDVISDGTHAVIGGDGRHRGPGCGRGGEVLPPDGTVTERLRTAFDHLSTRGDG